LFFTRLENLEDPLEGHHPRGYYKAMGSANITVQGPELPANFDKMILNSAKQLVGIKRRYICVNCWYQSKFESDAMWRIYSRDGQGIAIQSTVQRLFESFIPSSYEVIVGKVGYVDFRAESLSSINPIPGFQKDWSYEHEREVRATIWSKDVDGMTFDEMLKANISSGHYIPVNLSSLIEKIYLSPNAADWHHRLILKLLEMHNLNVPVAPSSYRSIPDDFLPTGFL
jgi:hypothetical protein